ncbi:hypothetical protein [Aquimarina pacifica]|uniref:hypothetical protein n=1 Tax=Aquimarina pacifica TaxID=1296415 RepID=UPI0004721547|nr:hypothetical protein [Aquimarina pacifica]
MDNQNQEEENISTPTDQEGEEEDNEGGTENEETLDVLSIYDDTIVFNFSEKYTVGQFANGDYWVHNDGSDVIITDISPASTTMSSGRVINGTMLNPENSSNQGYDSESRDMQFEASLNMDPGFLETDLVVQPNTSVVKSISMESDEGRPIIKDAVVLTVLTKTPPEGSFRPPYTGTDKNIIATLADVDYSALKTYPKLGDEPDIAEAQKDFERVWLEHCTEWTQRDIHPDNNMPAYGRDMAATSGRGLVLLQLDYTNLEKEKLLIGMIQYGIDIYGVAKSGGVWYNNGGHNLGRKMPLLLAAKVLNSEEMLIYADKEEHFIFQDDQQHFYVSQVEVDITNSSDWAPDPRADLTAYTASDIGIPEWGIRHTDRPQADNANWGATYRHVNGPSQFAHILAANLMDVKDDWNWSPVFDYASRYYEIEKSGELGNDYLVNLWEAYVIPNMD